jgi:hypothetical protein
MGKNGLAWLPILIGLLLCAPAGAADPAPVFRDDCGAVGSGSEPAVCFDRTTNTLKRYDGTRLVSDLAGARLLDVRDFGASPAASARANTLAFRAAGAAITDGAIVYTPPGRYLVTPGLIYTLDSASGDHNGIGDAIVQVKEAIDPAVITAATGTLSIQMGPTPSGPLQVTYTSYTPGAPGRFTLAGPLTADLTENHTAEVDGLALFAPMGKSGVRFVGAGRDLTEIEFDARGSGRIVGRTDCRHWEPAYLKITGTQSNGHPYRRPERRHHGISRAAGSADGKPEQRGGHQHPGPAGLGLAGCPDQ